MVRIVAGLILTPSMATGSPLAKSMSMYVALSGACGGWDAEGGALSVAANGVEEAASERCERVPEPVP